jgi:GNAT superfamily N-acetyltransferase
MKETDLNAPSNRAWTGPSVRNFLAGAIQESGHKILEDEKEAIYLCTKKRVSLPEVGPAVLEMHYQDRKQNDIRHDKLDFRYDFRVSRAERPLIADMLFAIVNTHDFRLHHRLVDEQYRHNGIGSALLRDAEEWFQALAKAQGTEVTLTIPAAQVSVIRWALKNGYQAQAWDQTLLQDVLERPEQFDIEDIMGSDGIKRDGYIFPKNGREKIEGTAIRFDLKKILSPEK